MGYSNVGIANLALLKLGKPRIASFDDNGTVNQIFAEQFDTLRDTLLRMGWNFARTYATLSALTTPPPFQYIYAFALPSDFIRLEWAGPAQPIGTQPPGNPPPPQTVLGMPGMNLNAYNNQLIQDYRIVGNQIWTSITSTLSIIYARRVTDPNLFDAYFVEALASYCAEQLCEAITGSNAKFPRFEQEFQEAIAQAIKYRSLENPPTTIPDDTWMMARVSG